MDEVGVKTIIIKNISKVEIEIPVVGDQSFVFLEAQKKWISVQEQMHYDEAFVLYPKADFEKGEMRSWLCTVDPDLSEFDRPLLVRVVVIGEIIENGKATGNKVGSYVDLKYD